VAVKLKRAYEAATRGDGERYLVERLWPRGVAKDKLAITGWPREIAPSAELRTWYGHRRERWGEFAKRYRSELRKESSRKVVRTLASKARSGTVTLVFATKDVDHSGAAVLKDVIEREAARG
jgi:uncharacterized protein YeaO (DUF488 family)